MQKKRILKIISVVLILVLICVSITYVKSGNKEVLATTKEFNSENLQDNEHMHVELDNSGDKVPVPNGYVGSKATGENEIDTGYVIYEGEEEVNDENVEEAQKTRNQYVWIPVPDISKFYGTDANGKRWGKLYTFSSNMGSIDELTGARTYNWSENNGILSIIDKNDECEPSVNLRYNIDSNLKKQLGDLNQYDLLIQLEKEFNLMIESVKRYGGFYIGRYETANISKEQVIIRKNGTNIAGSSWFSLYKKCKMLKGNSNNVTTGMIWGNQWDRTLMWLIETENKTGEEIKNSTTWGNYQNSTFEYINNDGEKTTKKEESISLIPTGSTEYTNANNIYDLAGNVYELTMEGDGIYGRAVRGGSAWTNGNVTSSSYRLAGGNGGNATHGCRAMLYIK